MIRDKALISSDEFQSVIQNNRQNTAERQTQKVVNPDKIDTRNSARTKSKTMAVDPNSKPLDVEQVKVDI